MAKHDYVANGIPHRAVSLGNGTWDIFSRCRDGRGEFVLRRTVRSDARSWPRIGGWGS